MPTSNHNLTPRSAFAGIPLGELHSAGRLVVEDRDGLGLATVLVGKNKHDALRQRMTERFGIALPGGPKRVVAGPIAFAGVSVGAWLAVREGAGNAFALQLREALGDLAAISDQSDSLAGLRLRGPAARETLARMLPLDMHPRAFRTGDVAVTMAEHIGVTLWRLDDDSSGHAAFEIAVYRSYAADFASQLSDAVQRARKV